MTSLIKYDKNHNNNPLLFVVLEGDDNVPSDNQFRAVVREFEKDHPDIEIVSMVQSSAYDPRNVVVWTTLTIAYKQANNSAENR